MFEVDEVLNIEEVEGEEGEVVVKKKFSGKMLVLFIIVFVFFFIFGGGGVYMFLFLGGDEMGEDGYVEVEYFEEEVFDLLILVFYELLEMLVNLNISGDGIFYLKLKVVIELELEDDIMVIEFLLFCVVDCF